jgi:transcriptional regulator with XRE-family HTH domain
MNEVEIKSIGGRVRKARKQRGYNQTQLAEMIGKSLRTVQKYEKGEIEPSIAVINEIARKLGTTSTYLLGNKSTDVQLDCIADVIGFLFEMEKNTGLQFDIDVKRPPNFDGWQCSIIFNGKDKSAESNADICLFLEDWKDRIEDYGEDRITNQKYAEWQDKTLAYYAVAALYAEKSDD